MPMDKSGHIIIICLHEVPLYYPLVERRGHASFILNFLVLTSDPKQALVTIFIEWTEINVKDLFTYVIVSHGSLSAGHMVPLN